MAGVVAAGVLAAAAAGLFWSRFVADPAEVRLLRSLPSGQAVYAYFDAGRLRRSRLLGPRIEQVFFGNPARRLMAEQLEAGALAVGADTVYVVLAAAVPEPWLRDYLDELGADCAQPLDEAACRTPLPDTTSADATSADTSAADASAALSVRLLAGGVVGVANGPAPNAADSLAALSGAGSLALAAPAAEAIAAGALAWVEIDPPRLAAVMRNPPQGWINLSLVARALIHAQQVRLTLWETGDDLLLLRLQASSDDAEELARLLEGLNRFGAAALRKGGSAETKLWARALESFAITPNDNGVVARWSLDIELLAGFLSP